MKHLVMASYSCHLCQAPVLFKHTVAIFCSATTKCLQKIKNLLDIQLHFDDGLPEHVCLKYKW